MKPVHSSGRKLSQKYLAIWLGAVAIVGLGLSYISGLPYWGACAIIAAVLVVTGLIAEIEDKSPGGFLSTENDVSTPNLESQNDA